MVEAKQINFAYFFGSWNNKENNFHNFYYTLVFVTLELYKKADIYINVKEYAIH